MPGGGTQLRKLLSQAGRQRGIDAEAARLQAVLRAEYPHHPPLIEDAFGKQVLALLRQLNVACSNADELAAATVAHFDQHPDAEIITSPPRLGSLTGARILPRSAMTDPALPTLDHSRPTPAARRHRRRVQSHGRTPCHQDAPHRLSKTLSG